MNKKLEKAVFKMDPTAIELANEVSDIVIKYYGKYNIESFKKVINERLV